MSSADIQAFKDMLDTHEQKLKGLEVKWGQDALLKQLTKTDHILKVVVMSKRMTSTLIPKLKFKLECSLRSPENQRLAKVALDEWNATNPKVVKTLDAFDKLDSGSGKGTISEKSIEQDYNQHHASSHSIEKALRTRRKLSSTKIKLKQYFSLDFSEDRRDDSAVIEDDQDLNSETTKSEILENVASMNKREKTLEELMCFKNQLGCIRGRNEESSKTADGVCRPEGVCSNKETLQSMVLSNPTTVKSKSNLVDEIRNLKFGREGVKDKEKVRKKALAARREQLNREAMKLAESVEKDMKSLEVRSALPMPLPFDNFLRLIETLPGEIQDLVRDESEALVAIQKADDKMFMRKDTWSDRKGRMVSMDKLRQEFRDDRFDASDFHVRVQDAMVDEKYLNELKNQEYCNTEEWLPTKLNVRKFEGLLEGGDLNHTEAFVNGQEP